MNEGMIHYTLNKIKRTIYLEKKTEKNILLKKKKSESSLADCISTLCKVVSSPTQGDNFNLISEYLNKKRTKITKFKDNQPDYDCFPGFIKRYKLLVKKLNMISAA